MKLIKRAENKNLGIGGNFSVEAAVVVPGVLLIICLMFGLNMFFFTKMVNYEKVERNDAHDCADTHRLVSTLFDAGGDIYEMLFG